MISSHIIFVGWVLLLAYHSGAQTVIILTIAKQYDDACPSRISLDARRGDQMLYVYLYFTAGQMLNIDSRQGLRTF
jgi:hypothetical protein